MKQFLARPQFKIAVFVIVLVFTFLLRAHNYEKTPTPNHLDEMLYAWSGIYLVETGTPVSWSTLDYPKRAEVFKGEKNWQGGYPKASVTLYKPWLDQPPLFSLLVGYVAHLYKASRESWIPSSYIRLPMVFIATVVSLLIFLIAKKTNGFWTGILAMMIYGLTPVFVFGARTALPENLIALFLCLIVYLLLLYEQKLQLRYLWLIPILSGLAGLAKPTGYALIIFGLFWFILTSARKFSYKKILVIIAALIGLFLPFVAAYFVYGNYYDPAIFARISQIQASRPVGFASLTWFFISPSYRAMEILKDGWYMFCLLALAFFMIKPPVDHQRIVLFAAVFWILVVMLSGGEGDLLPWYRFGAFPFLAIIGAWGVSIVYKNTSFFTNVLVVGLFVSSRSLLVNAFRPNITPSDFRLTVGALLTPSVLNWVFPHNWLKNLTVAIITITIIVGGYLNIIYIYNAYELACENQTCPIVPTTFISSLHLPVVWRWMVLKDLK